MENRAHVARNSAAGMVAVTFGILAGLGGLTHAIGEIRQGNNAPTGIVFNSWAEGPIATSMGGEPAMTIIPNLLTTGILSLIVSLAVLVWAARFVHRQNGGRILIGLSIGMLLVGGGFGPPIMGILAGMAGTAIHAPLTWWREHLPSNMLHGLAVLWPWAFGVTVANGVFLVIGSLILIYFFGLNNADLFVNSFFFAVVSILGTTLTAIAYDLQQQPRRVIA